MTARRGFDMLNTPLGMVVTIASLMLIIAFICAGAAFMRRAEARDREERRLLGERHASEDSA